MRYYEEQQFYMLKSVLAFLKKNRDKLVARVPALNDLIEDFVGRCDELVKLSISRKNIVRVSSGEKKTIKEGLVDALMLLSGMLYAHHYKEDRKETVETEGGEAQPKTDFDYTVSELNRMSSAKLCRVTEQVIQASKKVKHLHRYGISEGDVKDAESYYEEFSASKDKPTLSKKEVAGRNRAISRGIKKCISLLDNRIDRLMRIAAREDDALNREYNSRRVVLGKMFGRPSDRESRYRKSRRKKIDAQALIRKYVKAYGKMKMPVMEAILFGTYAKRQAYSDSKINVALISESFNEREIRSLANTRIAHIQKQFPTIEARHYSPEAFKRDDAFINQIKRTGVKVEV